MLQISLAPVFDRNFTCTDHFCGDVTGLGDELGCDVQIISFLPESGEEDYLRPYRNDGSRNEDWFTFGAKVYAPVSGIVEKIHICPLTNKPGIFNPTFASSITVRVDKEIIPKSFPLDADLHIILAHIERPVVKVGDRITEGQHIAYGGNNGWSHCPHVHLGAWCGDQPVAICFDREKTGTLYQSVGRRHWFFGV
ncbi:MAG: peptidoglycan DD-metalloendopeptidase family protein [Firmicutes bacterium]|nr:peptidoglycan DD-metalloendopeptidase family protein [Bacillota bacterium]